MSLNSASYKSNDERAFPRQQNAVRSPEQLLKLIYLWETLALCFLRSGLGLEEER
jgi:hypothetical protein